MIELSKEEIEMIDVWYCASAGESAHGGDRPEDLALIKGLLAKLNIKPHSMDEDHLGVEAK